MSHRWHWLDKQGVQRVADVQALTAAIERGIVSPDAPVWRDGMAAFAPASHLPAFADACKRAGIKKGEGPADPPGELAPADPAATEALQRTLERARSKRAVPPGAAGIRRASPPPSTAPVPALDAVPTKPLGTLRTADTSRPPARPSNSAKPEQASTLLGIAPAALAPPPVPAPSDTPALDPLPDPPSQAPSPATPRPEPPPAVASDAVDRSEDTPPATPIARNSRRVAPDPAPDAAGSSALWTAQPDAPPGVDLVAIPVQRSYPSIDPDSPSVVVAPPSLKNPEMTHAGDTQRTRALRSRRFLYPVIATVGAIGVVGLAGVGLHALRSKPSGRAAATHSTTPSPTLPASTSTASSSSPAPAVDQPSASTAACIFRGARKRIVVGASKDIPIEVWAQPDDPRVAVGFAARNGTALGFVLDPKTLEPKKSFTDKPAHRLRRVVPTRGSDNIAFAVDTDDPTSALQNTLTVATTPPLRLGTFKDALTIETTDSTVPDVLWTLPTTHPLEAVRAAVAPGKGLAVVFRMNDSVWVGWVTDDRKPGGRLTRVPGTGVQVGTPSIGWNGREMLVAFADLPSRDAAWTIRLTRFGFGQEPVASEPWSTPDGGPGGPAIAPSVFGLGDGRWIMVWTEGNPGARDVRAQTYDAAMRPLGDAFTVSEAGGNAGQGVAAVGSAGGVIMYLAALGKMYEVWGASIECP